MKVISKKKFRFEFAKGPVLVLTFGDNEVSDADVLRLEGHSYFQRLVELGAVNVVKPAPVKKSRKKEKPESF